jgi:hypothetical protein
MSTCRIKGVAAQRAQSLQYTGGQCVVRVLIDTGCGLPVLAERCFGTGPAASHAAGNAATAIRKGMQVTAHGKGLALHRHDNAQALRLEAVDLIEHDATNHTEPAARAA